jgi:hypothetical protein
MLFTPDNVWQTIKDGDIRALELFKRHYSFYHYKDGRKRTIFVGPGEKIVLLTHCERALFVWRKFISLDKQEGINCAIFRNESIHLASDLIRAAEAIAWNRWPGARLYTYVNARKVRSINPGCCFRRAGWTRCGVTKKRELLIFEKHATA